MNELLDGGTFYSRHEAKVIVVSCRRHDDSIRQNGSIDYEPSAPEVFMSAPPAMLMLAHRWERQARP